MWSLLTAIIGFIGGLVLAHFSAMLGRRNWQLQQAMQAYAQLFTQGGEALRLLFGLWARLANLNHDVGADATIAEAMKADPSLGHEYEHLSKRLEELDKNEEREFRHLLTQCWMLERDQQIRSSIEKLQEKHLGVKVGLRLLFQKLHDRRKQMYDDMIARQPDPESLSNDLDELQRQVARKYFHGEQRASSDGSGTAT